METRTKALYALASLLAFAFIACDSSTEAPGAGSGLTARYEGEAWEAEPIGVYANALGSSPGTYIFGGTQTKGGITRSIVVTLYNIGGPGTYALGTDMNVTGGMAQAGEGTGTGANSNAWITDGTGRIQASFRFTAVPGKNNALTANRTVTEGRVDLPYKGTPLPVLDKHGGTLTATLGGKPYNAASIYASLVDVNGNPGVNITTTTSLNGISLLVSGATAPGIYPVLHKQPNPVSIGVGRNGTSAETCCWGGGGESDTAEVEITSITATRVKGRFHGRLIPSPGKPATAPLEVADGKFDVGIN